MGRIRNTLAAAAVGAAIAAHGAAAQTTPDPPPAPTGAAPEPSGQPQAPAAPGAGIEPARPKPDPDQGKGKPDRDKQPSKEGGVGAPSEEGEKGDRGKGEKPVLPPLGLGLGSCASSIPPWLIPIYQAASDEYGLGPGGPSILAAINEIESAFGTNMGPSSAGAIGWMQFMPSTWDAYGVDADGDGERNPWDADDAIFGAANYLSASGMPESPEGAIYAYNHADWYVADVLERAACFSGIGGFMAGVTLLPERKQFACTPAKSVRNEIPEPYLKAIENAAARYSLGEDGVWALAAVARLESDFGRGMTAAELRASGPFGLAESNWERFAVDGDGDGRVARQSPADAASTLARMIWASGGLREGLFAHNHASWYVEEVLDEAASSGECQITAVAYSISLPGPTSFPINWENVELSNALEVWDLQRGAIDPRVLGLIAAISHEHEVLLSSLRSDHSMLTTSGNVSNHFFGRAMDIAAVDGSYCTLTSVDGPCGRLARALARLPLGQRPTELIYCFDPDGAGPAWAQSDHCDHIHAGFDV